MRRFASNAPWMPALAGLLLALVGSRATPAATSYQLETPYSRFEIGCQAPCACPVWDVPISGSFAVSPAGVDPLYSYYDLSNIDWKLDLASGPLRVTGTGRYQVGGEVAVMHRLTLDLVVGTHPLQHFDSGLVQGGGTWPELRIEAAVHDFFCFDTIAVLAAKPATADGEGHAGLWLGNARPNPSSGETAIPIGLGVDGTVDLRVFDAAGRLSRVLASGEHLPAGSRTYRWDGLRDDGRPAPPGLYWVRLVAPEGVAWRRLVRLQ